jgi:hypothetical protein
MPKLTIRFDKAGEKRVVDSFVERVWGNDQRVILYKTKRRRESQSRVVQDEE